MLQRLRSLIKGGKRVQLVGGPGNGLSFILDGKAQSLEYECDGKKTYYKWSGLTDGRYEFYTFLGSDKAEQPSFFSSISNRPTNFNATCFSNMILSQTSTIKE